MPKRTVLLYCLFFLVPVIFIVADLFDFKEVMMAVQVTLGIIISLALIFRYKALLLLSLGFFVPLSVPLAFGNAKISFPSELICVALTGFFLFKIITGHKLPKNFIKHPLTLLIIADLSWMLFCSSMSIDPIVSYKRFIIRTLYYVSFYYFYFELFRINKKNISTVFLVHCLGFLIPMISAVIKHSAAGLDSLGSLKAAEPFYNDHTMYGAALVFFIPFLFISIFHAPRQSLRVASAFLVIAFIICAFLSFSRAAWLSLLISSAIGIVLYFRISYKWVGLAVVSGIVLIMLNGNFLAADARETSHSNNIGTHFKSISNTKTDVSNTERINRWKCALRMFIDKPLLGFGPGTFQFMYGKYQMSSEMTTISTYHGIKGHAHSEYLNYLSESGFPGLLMFLSIITLVCFKALQLIRNKHNKETSVTALYLFLGLLTFFIHGIFNGFIEFEKLAMPVFMSYAALVYLDTELQSKSQA